MLKILTNKSLTVYINMYMHNNVALNIDFLLQTVCFLFLQYTQKLHNIEQIAFC